MAIGPFIADLREALGLSQGDLATLLCDLSERATLTREDVSRWERAKRTPGPFWLPYLATALEVPLPLLEAERVKRRTFITAASLAPFAQTPMGKTAHGVMTSIASGDTGPLTLVQTSHHTDLLISALVTQDQASMYRLARWMEDGDTDVLRVNAAGILAKTPATDLADRVSLCLARDVAVGRRYLTAVQARIGDDIRALTAEVTNPRDIGARWCAAQVLGRVGTPAARDALTSALRNEPVRENIRAIALTLNGDTPWK